MSVSAHLDLDPRRDLPRASVHTWGRLSGELGGYQAGEEHAHGGLLSMPGGMRAMP